MGVSNKLYIYIFFKNVINYNCDLYILFCSSNRVYRSNFSLFQAYLTNRVRYFILGTLHLWKENKVSFELCNICTWRAKRIRRTGISKYKRGAENMRVRERRSWGFVKLCVSRWKWKIKWRSRIGNYYVKKFNRRFFESIQWNKSEEWTNCISNRQRKQWFWNWYG